MATRSLEVLGLDEFVGRGTMELFSVVRSRTAISYWILCGASANAVGDSSWILQCHKNHNLIKSNTVENYRTRLCTVKPIHWSYAELSIYLWSVVHTIELSCCSHHNYSRSGLRSASKHYNNVLPSLSTNFGVRAFFTCWTGTRNCLSRDVTDTPCSTFLNTSFVFTDFYCTAVLGCVRKWRTVNCVTAPQATTAAAEALLVSQTDRACSL